MWSPPTWHYLDVTSLPRPLALLSLPSGEQQNTFNYKLELAQEFIIIRGLSWARDNILGSGHGLQWVQCITVASFVYLTISSVNRVFIGYSGLGSRFRLGERKDTPGPLFQVFLTYSILVLRSQIRVWGRRRRESLLQAGSFSFAAALVYWVADHPHRRPRFAFLSLSRLAFFSMVISTFSFSFFISLLIIFLFFVCSRDSCFRKKLNVLDSVEVLRKISDIVVRGRGFLFRFYHRLHLVLFHGQLDFSLFFGGSGCVVSRYICCAQY